MKAPLKRSTRASFSFTQPLNVAGSISYCCLLLKIREFHGVSGETRHRHRALFLTSNKTVRLASPKASVAPQFFYTGNLCAKYRISRIETTPTSQSGQEVRWAVTGLLLMSGLEVWRFSVFLLIKANFRMTFGRGRLSWAVVYSRDMSVVHLLWERVVQGECLGGNF